MITLKYNQPVRVNRATYDRIMGTLDKIGAGDSIMAGRIDKRGQCFVKCWGMEYKNHIEKILNGK